MGAGGGRDSKLLSRPRSPHHRLKALPNDSTSVARVRIIVVSDRGQITYGKTCLDNVEPPTVVWLWAFGLRA